MKIIPAIDLQNGEAVRLYKGDYDKKTVYSKNPLEIAQKFERMGATDLHLVDLDGAKIGQTRNLELVRKIKDETRLKIEIGGDIREGFVSTSGWLEKTSLPYLSFLKKLERIGVKTTIITDISKDGTLTGPNFKLYDEISKESSLNVIISGGVKDNSDIQRATRSDFYGIIVGKAYYEKKINLEKEFRNAN